ncbi:MAG TPA: alpha/beta fold hydrolase [Candidatus Binatia bacterium]|nr:alpha/beta fold hydrolase [Candidatus Binatia bacterium]
MSGLVVHRFGPSQDRGHASPDVVPVLTIHGVMGHGARFGPLAATAFPDRRVLAPDLRGHGGSTWDPPWDAATHVADLVAVLDEAGVERADVVGHSFGGLLATHLAVTAPDRVRRVVLLDPAIGVDAARIRDEAELIRLDDGWPTFDAALAARLADRPPQAIELVRADVKAHLAQGDDGRFRLRFSRSAVIVGWSEIARPPASLRDFPGEVLLVIAESGTYVAPALRRGLATDLGPRFVERTVAAGHMIWWDALTDTAVVVGAFLDGRDVPLLAPRADDETLERMLRVGALSNRTALGEPTAPH